jgi:hypothetical protein
VLRKELFRIKEKDKCEIKIKIQITKFKQITKSKSQISNNFENTKSQKISQPSNKNQKCKNTNGRKFV